MLNMGQPASLRACVHNCMELAASLAATAAVRADANTAGAINRVV
jgi:hypothetical protein